MSLKRTPRFRLAPHRAQNGACPGYGAILRGECALCVLNDLFWCPGRFMCIGSRTPAQGAYPSAVEALSVRNTDLPGEWSLSTEPASSIGAHRCWLGTTPPEGRSERYTTAPRSVQRLPGLAQNRYQDSTYLAMGLRPAGAPPATGHCRRRSGGGLQNAILAFQPPWYKFETPCPLVRPSQTHLGRSARAPVDRGPWVFGEGW